MIGLKQKIMMAGLSLGIGAVWTPQILEWSAGAGAAGDQNGAVPAEVPNASTGVDPQNVEVNVARRDDPAATSSVVEPDSLQKALGALDALRSSGAGVDLSILSEVGGTVSTPLTVGPEAERVVATSADRAQDWLAASTLTATLVGSERPLALFGSRVLHVGDEIVPPGADGRGGLTVSAIGSDHVLFAAGEREYRVDLPVFRTTGRSPAGSSGGSSGGGQEPQNEDPGDPSQATAQEPQ